ncbi:MAG: hypothetical protein PHP04_00565 [Bacteroidales bacterium]|nr:hypothetical protein [Bacteroidales bacterium]HNW75026.1 hypothetical protein [Bacteroidales bacterium]HPS49417.1 hypothetical protein [Bacteroidales bacterium]
MRLEIRRWALTLTILFFVCPLLFSGLPPQESKVNQRRIEKEREKKKKEAVKKYEQAVKRHQKMQSKDTKSRMKQTRKESRKNTPLKP